MNEPSSDDRVTQVWSLNVRVVQGQKFTGSLMWLKDEGKCFKVTQSFVDKGVFCLFILALKNKIWHCNNRRRELFNSFTTLLSP